MSRDLRDCLCRKRYGEQGTLVFSLAKSSTMALPIPFVPPVIRQNRPSADDMTARKWIEAQGGPSVMAAFKSPQCLAA